MASGLLVDGIHHSVGRGRTPFPKVYWSLATDAHFLCIVVSLVVPCAKYSRLNMFWLLPSVTFWSIIYSYQYPMEFDSTPTTEGMLRMAETPDVPMYKKLGLLRQLEKREAVMEPAEARRLEGLRHRSRREINIALRIDQ